MKKGQWSEGGFGVAELLIVLVVVVVLGVAGWLVYRDGHKSSATGTATSITTRTATKQSVNSYAGWQTYTDSVNHYSFMYPTGWTLSSSRNVYGKMLLSPDETVTIGYEVIQPVSVTTVTFTAVSIAKLTSTNEDLSVVGGYSYSTAASSYSPGYFLMNSSVLSDYPLTVGRPAPFPAGPTFTLVGNANDVGYMYAAPTSNVTTLSDAQAWLNSADAKTGLLMLESTRYND